MKHLNEDTIQAFLDGELHEAQMSWAAGHLALCEHCTNALIKAESEVAEINLAFAAERAEGIPTQRIWARIENEIDLLSVPQSHSKAGTKSFWQNLGAFFTPAQIAFTGSFAGIVLISLFALSVLNQQQDTNRENNIAYQDYQNQPPTARNISPTQDASIKDEKIREEARPLVASKPDTGLINNPNVLKASYKSSSVKQVVKIRESEISSKSKIQKTKSEDATPLLEEKEYLTSIAQLSKAVSSSDEIIMRPSFRVEYESNIARMDKVISETQRQARRNPNDENAKRALFASYQNKIDLLNTVAEKTQLMATVR